MPGESVHPRPAGGGGNAAAVPQWLVDPQLQRQRLIDQVAIIQAEMNHPIAVLTDDDGRPGLIFASDHILVRHEHWKAVRRVLRRNLAPPIRGDRRHPIGGLVCYPVAIDLGNPGDPGPVLAALRILATAFGPGVATPDHVVYLTGANDPASRVGCCPAKEPEPVVDPQPTPDPPPNLDRAASGRGVRIAVVDSGMLSTVCAQHEFLNGVTGEEEEFDGQHIGHYTGHGTFIAGVIRCLAPAAEVRVHNFFDKGGAILESELVERIDDSLNATPDIISLSAGATTEQGRPLLSFQVLWETRLQHLKGTVVVAAAGNDGNRGPFWPAAFPWTIAVGALDASESQRAPYTDFGSWVDVYARGSDIVNAFPVGTHVYDETPKKGEQAEFTNGWASWSGTSFATPVVVGLIAQRMSKTGESARDAAAALLKLAHDQSESGIGPILRLSKPGGSDQG